MTTADGYASFAIEDLGGGSFGTGVQIIHGARFESYDYNGKAAEPRMCLRLDMYSPEHGSASSQYWGVGDAMTWSVSPDGSQVRNNKGGPLQSSSGFAQFLKGLGNAGFPPDKLKTGKASDFIGLKLNMVEVKTGRKDSNDKEITAVVPSAILAWDARAEIPAAGTQPAAPVPPPQFAAPPPIPQFAAPAPMAPPSGTPPPMAPPPIMAPAAPPQFTAPPPAAANPVETAIITAIGQLGMASNTIELGALAAKLFADNRDQAFQQQATPLLFGEKLSELAALHGFVKQPGTNTLVKA